MAAGAISWIVFRGRAAAQGVRTDDRPQGSQKVPKTDRFSFVHPSPRDDTNSHKSGGIKWAEEEEEEEDPPRPKTCSKRRKKRNFF